MSVAVSVEGLGKQYRLGLVGTGTFTHDLNRWWHRVRGNPDPYLKVTETNDRTIKGGDYVWALRDVNFSVNQGDTIGIIGRNGAGKSTLLKILSRTTAPTTGNVKIKGRIASLLEVGTGFHPELTGRENVYLNGAILGMRRHEIKSQFDEIISFAGVEKYIDTPVKRYSSGMYVRLAFAVAAHLEPDILIVDEVLAVGDVEFQKRALGKMKDVSSSQGRTVLFVSHNIGAIKTLCATGIMLQNGQLMASGDIDSVVSQYLTSIEKKDVKETWPSPCGRFVLQSVYLTNQKDQNLPPFAFGDDISLNFHFRFSQPVPKINVGFAILNDKEERIFTSHLSDDTNFSWSKPLSGDVIFKTKFDLRELAPGRYTIIFGVRDEHEKLLIQDNGSVAFEIDKTFTRESGNGVLWHTTNWNIHAS